MKGEALVEADVLKVIVLIVVMDGLREGESLLHKITTLEFHITGQVVLHKHTYHMENHLYLAYVL